MDSTWGGKEHREVPFEPVAETEQLLGLNGKNHTPKNKKKKKIRPKKGQCKKEDQGGRNKGSGFPFRGRRGNVRGRIPAKNQESGKWSWR